ncbi:hypothetical protein NQ315_001650 [Exocentrus adspersus]|uniref:Uncharacterized protein n=1 Tax=Exocentrus adspersus TaxID=1586481 RepID=A0AAV8W9T8_9CUCU|nr:hypothetical protein NQ315_001650 [Exocentrus adspersus]
MQNLNTSQVEVFNETAVWKVPALQEIGRVDVEVATSAPPKTNQSTTPKSIKELLYNGTGYYIDDETDAGLNDLQTVFLACIATLIPLIVILLTAFAIRILWKRYRRRKDDIHYDGMLHREGTSESITKPLHSHLLTDKPCEDTHLAISTEDVEVCDGTEINSQIRSNNHSNTNGSIITMTLKNNHLIVETEERSVSTTLRIIEMLYLPVLCPQDIEKDSRETTMKYCTGARNGVFVVEVQQGVRRSPGSGGPTSCAEPEVSVSVSDQCALVHNPPDRYSDEETLEECDDSEYYMETTSPHTETPDSLATAHLKTGLSRSNSSLTRPSYCYTTQQCYDAGTYGYNVYAGYVNDEPSQRLQPDDTRPKIMSAVYKNPLAVNRDSVDIPLASMEMHLATINGLKEAINDIEKSSDEEQEEQRRMDEVNLLKKSPRCETAEAKENGGVDCSDAAKS